jgi:hypothetical protein
MPDLPASAHKRSEFIRDPIEVVMASAQPKPDFDREWAEPNVAQTTSSPLSR